MDPNAVKRTLDELDGLMREFGLAEATLQYGDVSATFRKNPPAPVMAVAGGVVESAPAEETEEAFEEEPETPEAPAGTPVISPMSGIFYSAPSPGQPAFVKEGDSVIAGQTLCLIEAMKVFNEIPCPVAGTVLKVVARPEAVVAQGDVLMYIG